MVPQSTWRYLTTEEREGKLPHGAHGLCFTHWRRQRRHGTFTRVNPPRGVESVNWEIAKCSEPLCEKRTATKGALKHRPELRDQGIKRRRAHGRCEACYDRVRRTGGSALSTSHDVILEEWEFMRDAGESLYVVANRLGISPGTLENICREARRRGDRRGGLLPHAVDMGRMAA